MKWWEKLKIKAKLLVYSFALKEMRVDNYDEDWIRWYENKRYDLLRKLAMLRK